MPNVGRPSKGCKNCRDRKVKCDQKRPSCSQCIRVGKECYGYRDPLNMMFRNESEVVARKAKSRYEKLSQISKRSGGGTEHHLELSSSSSTSSSSASDSSSSSSDSRSTSPIVDSSVSRYVSRSDNVVPLMHSENLVNLSYAAVPSIEQQGINFFLANFAQRPSYVPRGNLDFLHELLSSSTLEVLKTSVTAAGLAGLATTTKNFAVMQRAQEEYVEALRMTNKALQTTETAVRNETLVSVIVLDMYEDLMHLNKGRLKSRAKHVKGACTLIHLRGPDQFRDPISLRIFQQFYGTTLRAAIETGEPIPQIMNDFRKIVVSMGDYKSLGSSWTIQMTAFMARTITLSQNTTKSPMEMVLAAQKLDKELDALKQVIPAVWFYETVHLDQPVDYIFGNSYHVYIDPWICQMWNNLRSCQLILHVLVLNQIKKGMAEFPPFFDKGFVASQIAASSQKLQAASIAICAATPQIIGQVPFPEVQSEKMNESMQPSDIIDVNDPKYTAQPPGTFSSSTRPTGMNHLIMPLYAISANENAPYELKDWACKVLYFIALKVGMKQAAVFADELRLKIKTGFAVKTTDDSVPNLPTFTFGSTVS